MADGRTGLSLFLLGLCPALAAAQQEFPQPNTHHSWRSGPPDGSTIDVTYYVSPGAAGLNPNALPLIQQAAAAWNAAGASVNLVYGGTSGATPGINITTAFALTNTTNILTPPIGVAPDGHTLRQITSSSIQLNVLLFLFGHFNANTSPPFFSTDFYSLMLRQFGLALGLGFATTDTASVMDSTLNPGETHRTLSAGDIAALQHVYGTPEPATWTLFGLGLLGVGFGRKSRPRTGRPS